MWLVPCAKYDAYMRIRAHIRAHMTHICTYFDAFFFVCTHIFTYFFSYAHICAYMRQHVQICMHIYVQICKWVVFIFMYMSKYAHKYVHFFKKYANGPFAYLYINMHKNARIYMYKYAIGAISYLCSYMHIYGWT